MPRPQFSLLSIIVLLTISCAIAAWLSTASRFPSPRITQAVVGLIPPATGAPFPNFGPGLSIPFNQHDSWAAWWREHARQFWITATIATALAMVGLCWITLLSALRSPRKERFARSAWTLGFAFYLAHVCCAFALVHHWSHDQAAWHTEVRTWQLTGWYWSGGIWINYFFTLLWGGDVIYWWSGLDRYNRRPARFRWFIHAFFAFMIFQAGVVFASGATRWLTLAGLSIVALFGLLRLSRSRSPTPPGQSLASP